MLHCQTGHLGTPCLEGLDDLAVLFQRAIGGGAEKNDPISVKEAARKCFE